MGQKKTRGSASNARRLEAFGKGGNDFTADWSNCDPQWLQTVVAAITSIGGAVTIGLSRDRGAHMMTLLLDDEKEVLWFNGDADLTNEMKEIAGKLENLGYDKK